MTNKGPATSPASDPDPVGTALLRIRELARNGDTLGLIDELSNTLESDALTIRAAAMRQLVKLREPRARSPIAELMRTDRRKDVRVIAAWALGELAQRESIEPLESVLDDPSVVLQGQAVSSLGKIGDQRSVPAIARKLDASDSRLRKVAARALRQIGGTEAAEALQRAVPGKGFFERRRLRSALRSLR